MQLVSLETIQIRTCGRFVPRVITNMEWNRRQDHSCQWHEEPLNPVDLAKQQGLLDRLKAILSN